MDETGLKVIIRKGDLDQDQACIYSTWRKQAFYSAAEPITTSPTQFFKRQSAKIREILQTAKIRVACFEDSPEVIVGYAVITNTHLDWVYVKPDYRQKGIGALLVPKSVETYTDQLTKIGKIIKDKKNLKLKGESNVEESNSNRSSRSSNNL